MPLSLSGSLPPPISGHAFRQAPRDHGAVSR